MSIFEELVDLGRKEDSGELTDAEKIRLGEIRNKIFGEYANTPLVKEMTEVYQLAEVILEDGAQLSAGEWSTIHVALYKAGKDRLTLFTALKGIQRTHLRLAGKED